MKYFPLRLCPDHTSIDFMGKRWFGFGFSILMTLAAVFVMATQGLNFGIDFTGGMLMEIRTPEPANVAAMRDDLADPKFGEVALQNFGSERDVMIRIQPKQGVDQASVVARVKEILAEKVGPGIDYRKIDYVGPVVGEELKRSASIATLIVFAIIMAYIWFRFEWQFGLGAIAALAHDSVMMIGFYALSRFEFGLTAVAAVLTIVGYSINDSVVIYDRIRENMRKYKKTPINELLNLSVNETLARTVMTSGSTLLAAVALAVFGGEVLRGFSLALIFGIVVGTYSSIFISAPALIYLKIRPETREAAQPA